MTPDHESTRLPRIVAIAALVACSSTQGIDNTPVRLALANNPDSGTLRLSRDLQAQLTADELAEVGGLRWSQLGFHQFISDPAVAHSLKIAASDPSLPSRSKRAPGARNKEDTRSDSCSRFDGAFEAYRTSVLEALRSDQTAVDQCPHRADNPLANINCYAAALRILVADAPSAFGAAISGFFAQDACCQNPAKCGPAPICGDAGQPCCTDGDACTASGTECAGGTCTACGQKDQPCCAESDACGGSHQLVCGGQNHCVECGAEGEPCCTLNPLGPCAPLAACDGSSTTPTCISDPCSAAGQWTLNCPGGPSCGSCASFDSGTLQFFITAKQASAGAAWDDSGLHYELNDSACTLAITNPSANLCTLGPLVLHFNARGATADPTPTYCESGGSCCSGTLPACTVTKL